MHCSLVGNNQGWSKLDREPRLFFDFTSSNKPLLDHYSSRLMGVVRNNKLLTSRH